MSDQACTSDLQVVSAPNAGMGVFEYFQLAEALEAEPVWVINNGIAHEDSVPAAHIWPLVQVSFVSDSCLSLLLSYCSFPCSLLARALT